MNGRDEEEFDQIGAVLAELSVVPAPPPRRDPAPPPRRDPAPPPRRNPAPPPRRDPAPPPRRDPAPPPRCAPVPPTSRTPTAPVHSSRNYFQRFKDAVCRHPYITIMGITSLIVGGIYFRLSNANTSDPTASDPCTYPKGINNKFTQLQETLGAENSGLSIPGLDPATCSLISMVINNTVNALKIGGYNCWQNVQSALMPLVSSAVALNMDSIQQIITSLQQYCFSSTATIPTSLDTLPLIQTFLNRGTTNYVKYNRYHEQGMTTGAHSFSPDGKTFTIGISNRKNGFGIFDVVTFDIETGVELRRLNNFPFGEQLSGFAHSPDGKMIAVSLISSRRDTIIHIFSVETGKLILPPISEKHFVSGTIVFAPDGKTIVTAGGTGLPYRGQLILWDAETGAKIKMLNNVKSGLVDCRYSPDGHHILSRGGFQKNGELIIWDVTTGKKIREIIVQEDNEIYACDYSPDGRYILAGLTRLNSIYIYNAHTGAKVKSFNIEDAGGMKPSTCRYSPDGRYILYGGNGLFVLDTETGQTVTKIIEENKHIRSCSFSRDGRYLFSNFVQEEANLYELKLRDARSLF